MDSGLVEVVFKVLGEDGWGIEFCGFGMTGLDKSNVEVLFWITEEEGMGVEDIVCGDVYA